MAPKKAKGRRDAAKPKVERRHETLISPEAAEARMERMMASITRAIQERGLETREDIEAFLEQVRSSGEVPDITPRTPLEQAQNLIYDAWEEARSAKRVEMARKALEISPDCADAYVILAEETAHTLEEACELYEQGVKAGERALGPEMFKKGVGRFWEILETRPYMRARERLAMSLWEIGRAGEAVEHLWDMLRLNPNDNQGVRYVLSVWLLTLYDHKGLERLLKKYSREVMCYWPYGRALLAFRQSGPSDEANRLLEAAFEQNPYVPLYLLGLRKLPSRLPDYVSLGSETEAVEYVATSELVWAITPGALHWLTRRYEAWPQRPRKAAL